MSRNYETVYIWDGSSEKKVDLQKELALLGKTLYSSPEEYHNPGLTQCFYVGKKINPSFEKLFDEFYAVTVLLSTAHGLFKVQHSKRFYRMAEDTYNSVVAKNELSFNTDFIAAFSEYNSIFDFDLKSYEHFRALELRFLQNMTELVWKVQ